MNYLILGCIFFLACSNGHLKKKQFIVQQNSPITENVEQLLWGNADVIDTTVVLETVLNNLNNSRFKDAIKKLSDKYPLDTFYFDGYYGLRIRGNANPSPIEKYVLFRVNDYVENIWKDKLTGELFESIFNESDKLFQLQMVESSYLGSIDTRDNTLKRNVAGQLETLLLEYPESNRLKYLLANEYLELSELDKALKIFDKLIEEDYYALVSLRKILRYFLVNDNPLQKKYLQILTIKFPQACRLFYSKQLIDTVGEPVLITMCNQCVQSIFQEDSIFAKVYQAKYYLHKMLLNRVDSMYDYYEAHPPPSSSNDNYLLERGLYYDLKLRSLFLQNKYNEFVKFIVGIGANSVVNIENDEQFDIYIRGLFKDYISQDTSSFKLFIEKHFSSWSKTLK